MICCTWPSPDRAPCQAGTTIAPRGSAQAGRVTASASGITASVRIGWRRTCSRAAPRYLAPLRFTEPISSVAPEAP